MISKPLRYITVAFKALSLISAALGLAFFIIILVGGGSPEAPRPTSVLALILGAFYMLFFWTIAEVVGLLARIEFNTRKE